jgi:hypothetical protein
MKPEDTLDHIAQLELRLQRLEAHLDITDSGAGDTETEVTTTADLLRQYDGDAPMFSSDRVLSVSADRIRVPSHRLLAIGGEKSEKTQVDAFLDALHWSKWALTTDGPITFQLGKGYYTDRVVQMLSTLIDSLASQIEVHLQVDAQQLQICLPDLGRDAPRRLEQLRSRDATRLTPLAETVQAEIGDPCFQWVRTLTGTTCSGRVDGLEVCQLDENGQGRISIGQIGRTGRQSPARARFRELAGTDEFRFDGSTRSEAVDLIKKLVQDRRRGKLSEYELEHLLEARVLREAVAVETRGNRLKPLLTQFPAIWSEGGDTKYVDVVMQADGVPWVVELKVPEGGGQGQYFRHAVGQAVLYREFIRRAVGLHPWFRERDLEPSRCQAAVAFPLRGSETQRETALNQVRYLAELFNIHVVVLSDEWKAPDR